MSQKSTIDRQVNKTTQQVKPWAIRAAKLGYAAKGVVYLAWGFLALQAASGTGSAKVDTKDALLHIVTQPGGYYLLFVVAAGLVAYVFWRLVEFILNPEHGDLITRLGYLSSAVGNFLLAFTSYNILTGSGAGSGGSNSPRDFSAKLMSLPGGSIVVIIIGIVVAASGLYQIYYGYKAKFQTNMRLSEIKKDERPWAVGAGQLGTIARGIVYAIIGIFLIQAGLQHNPNKAGGLGDALVTLLHSPFGPYLLGFVALGLLAYGLYSEIMARYYRMAA